MKEIQDALGIEIKVGDMVIAILKDKGGQKTLGLADVVESKNGIGITLKPYNSKHELAYSRYTSKHIVNTMEREFRVGTTVNDYEQNVRGNR